MLERENQAANRFEVLPLPIPDRMPKYDNEHKRKARKQSRKSRKANR